MGEEERIRLALISIKRTENDGHYTNSKTYSGPVSNDLVTVLFTQPVAATDALRTGAYAKTLTYTLSTTNP